MKKISLLLLSGSFLLAGCQQQETIEDQGGYHTPYKEATIKNLENGKTIEKTTTPTEIDGLLLSMLKSQLTSSDTKLPKPVLQITFVGESNDEKDKVYYVVEKEGKYYNYKKGFEKNIALMTKPGVEQLQEYVSLPVK